MAKKIKVVIVMGGISGEHEVSLVSAWNIFNGLDRKKYEVAVVGIDKDGEWHFGKNKKAWVNPSDVKSVVLNVELPKVAAVRKKSRPFLIDIESGKNLFEVDVFFPITHGTFGEDGCLQGFFEILGAAYTGPGVLGSAVGMDKDFAKRLLSGADILNAEGYVLKSLDINSIDINEIAKDLGFPVFVKPASLGSSVGVSKANNKEELSLFIKKAFKYDRKVIVEKAIEGREIECSVMGNEKPIFSVPGEIKLNSEFYSYEAKYINENDAVPTPKAQLSEKQKKQIQETAVQVYDVLGCEGMARVDFFLTEKGELYVNEINTLPGFTSISMFPKMFEESGIKYSSLLDKIISFALDRKIKQDKLRRIK